MTNDYVMCLKRILFVVLNIFYPRIVKGKYLEFTIYFDKRNSLMGRRFFRANFKSEFIYEEDVKNAVANEISMIQNPVILDVGANLGLFIFNVLNLNPNAKIFAFEPGYFQYSLLKRNIIANKVEGLVNVENCALSKDVGLIEFALHEFHHSSGDGIIDTKRVPLINKTQVKATTIDEWWVRGGKPKVDLIKLDTEGSELWVLLGGDKFFEFQRPVIVIEISSANIKVYPYEINDVLNWLWQKKYRLYTLHGEAVTKENFSNFISNENFVARYSTGNI